MTIRTDTRPPFTVDGAAEALGLKPATIRSWIAQRRMGHVRLGRAVRVPASEIDRLLADSFVPPRDMRRQ